MPDASPSHSRSLAGWLLVSLAILPIAVFYAIGVRLPEGLTLDLGSLNFPTPRYVRFVALWSACGSLTVALVALGATRGLPGLPAFTRQLSRIPQRWFLIAATFAGFGIPLAIRMFVLRGAPLTDDEGVYRFGAELLASGRFWVASPPMKLFFDQNFLINDGRLYPAYFLGWPALLAPGVWLRSPGIVNPVLSAATVPLLFRVLRSIVGAPWALGGVMLFLASPFLQVAAATELSNTSWLLLTTCALSALVLLGRESGPWRRHVMFSASLALAFCIRPQSTVPFAVPMLVWWSLAIRRCPDGARLKALLATLLPAAVIGVVFLLTLWVQTGSPFQPGYAKYADYLRENQFRFATFTSADLTPIAGFDFAHVGRAAAHTVSGLLRLNADLFGWPIPFLLLATMAAWRTEESRLFWWMAFSFIAFMFFQHDWGIDTFGPMHAFELALPVLVLTVLGFRDFGRRLGAPVASMSFGALIVAAWFGFVPVRLAAVSRIADHVNVALDAPERAGLHDAVVFAPLPFAPRCGSVPGHFVVFRPPNDPDLRNDVLWVNHIDLATDRELVQALSGRVGHVMIWTGRCSVELLPLTALVDGAVPKGLQHP